MFVDELTIKAKAGKGGDGVVRWRREKFIPYGGPAGGNGGRGGDVYLRAVRDISILGAYTGSKGFFAEDGVSGSKRCKTGKDGEDMYIEVPVGATVTNSTTGHEYRCTTEGETIKILKGGRGGLGNENFKSATNQAPEIATKGQTGESGTFRIVLSLIVDAGLVGLPNAGKSTLLNTITNAKTKVGAYPFTTVEPHLGELYGYIIADIPGLIEGASEGKGLGHKFLRHIERTNMILHCVSFEESDMMQSYRSVRRELEKFNPELLHKEEWVILTKSDLVTEEEQGIALKKFSDIVGAHRVFVLSATCERGTDPFKKELVAYLGKGKEG